MRYLIAGQERPFRAADSGHGARRGRGGGFMVAGLAVVVSLGAPLTPAHAAATTFQFAAASNVATGASPQAIAVGDLNGDGKPDLVVADAADNTVSVLIGRGDGTFQPKVDYAVGNHPDSVAIADLNGKPDLVVANAADSTVSVLLGNGDGSFQPKVDYPTGAGPAALAVGNLNGDKKLDVIVADQGANAVSVLLGDGSGKLAAKTDFPTGTAPRAVAIADLNGDKHADVVTANHGADTVSVLLGDGSGTLAPKVDYATGAVPSGVAVGDLDANGKPDVVVADSGANAVAVLLGNGDGTLNGKVDYPAGTAPTAVAIGDLNADHRPDVVSSNSTADTVSLLLGRGDGTFASRRDLATGGGPQSLVLGDLNGDGRPDFAVADAGASSASVLLNTSVPTADSTTVGAFPLQLFGTKSAIQTVTVTNNGAAGLSIGSVAASANFSAAGCGGTSLAVGASCSISVVFAPKAYGRLTGTLTITSNAPGSPKRVALSGTGVPPAAAVTTTPVGNNVGSYATLNGTVLSQGPGTFYFEYGPTSAYGTVTPTLALSSSTNPQLLAVTVPVAPGSTYHYRIVAANLVGAVAGRDQAFATPPDPPVVTSAVGHARLAAVLRNGVPLLVSGTSPATVRITIAIGASAARAAHLPRWTKASTRVVIATATVHVSGRATAKVTVRLDRLARRRLRAFGRRLQRLVLAVSANARANGVVGSATEVTLGVRR